MKFRNLLLLILFFCELTFSQKIQNNPPFRNGEELYFRVRYGIFNTSFASLKIKDTLIDKSFNYHVVAHGETTGLAKLFFKVKDEYYSIFSKNITPLKFGRNIIEGSYTANETIFFNKQKNEATVIDLKNEIKTPIPVSENIQDIISAFYFFRTLPKEDLISKNTIYKLPMIYNEEGEFTFELRYIGEETVKTSLGKIQCYKFKPYLPNLGRIFKDPNAITIWVTNDENRIPVKVSAKIVVGSIHAELIEVKGSQAY
jgi:hypothetical protein